jgi:hypothetical protein
LKNLAEMENDTKEKIVKVKEIKEKTMLKR